MQSLKYYLAPLGLCLLFVVQCREVDEPAPSQATGKEFADDDIPPADNFIPANVYINWEDSAKKISHETYSAEYGRVHRVNGDTLLLVYHIGPHGNE